MIVTDKKFFMEKWLVEELDHLKKAVDKNWDGVILIDGVEGSAKTTLAGGVSYYLDSRYNLDSVVFTPKQFNDAVDNAPPKSAIHWDEFVLGGLSTEAMTKIQTTIIKKLATIRSKQLYIILVIPYIFMLRTYFAVGRTRFLLHTHTPDGLKRGYVHYFAYDNKRELFFNGKKLFDYSKARYNLRGRFVNTEGFFFNSKEYEKKKSEAVKSIDFEAKKEDYTRQRLKQLVYNLKTKEGYKQSKIAQLSGYVQQRISQLVTEYTNQLNVKEAEGE